MYLQDVRDLAAFLDQVGIDTRKLTVGIINIDFFYPGHRFQPAYRCRHLFLVHGKGMISGRKKL